MGATSRFTTSPSSLANIRKRLRAFVKQYPMKGTQLARCFLVAAQQVYPNREFVVETVRTRLIKILNGNAKAIARHEWNIFAAMFGCTERDLVGDFDGPVITVDNPGLPPEFRRLHDYHLPNVAEKLGWAEFFPCSLETEDFMVGEHKSRFGPFFEEYAEELNRKVKAFCDFGNKRRAEFGDPRKNWHMTHMMFQSDLALIADMTCEDYRLCSAATRRRLFNYLVELVQSDPKLHLVFVDDSDLADNRSISRFRGRLPGRGGIWNDFDSVVVFMNAQEDPIFGFWRNHDGSMHWASDTNPNDVSTLQLRADRLHAFQRLPGLSSLDDRPGVITLLESCKRRIK
jgi:hypothetical protein